MCARCRVLIVIMFIIIDLGFLQSNVHARVTGSVTEETPQASRKRNIGCGALPCSKAKHALLPPAGSVYADLK